MAAESIGTLVPTKIPGLSDAADIQAALRVYHYGSYTFDTAETVAANLVNPSIAYTINNLQTQITAITGGSAIQATSFNAKGDLFSASANDTLSVLTVGSNGKVLTANSATVTGLEWVTPEVTTTSTNTLSNKSISLGSNTITSTLAQLNTAVSDADLTSLAGAETLTNKTLTSPIITSPKITNSINAQTGTSYTLVSADQGALVTLTNASAITLTVSSGVFSVGQEINIAQYGAGQVTVVGSGTTIKATPGAKLRTQNSAATLICTESNVFLLVGDLSA